MTEVDLDLPASEIELGQRFGGVDVTIEQRCDQGPLRLRESPSLRGLDIATHAPGSSRLVCDTSRVGAKPEPALV